MKTKELHNDQLDTRLEVRGGRQHGRRGHWMVRLHMLSRLFCLLFWPQKSKSPKVSVIKKVLMLTLLVTLSFQVSKAQTSTLQLTAGNGLGITIDGTGRWGVDDGSAGQLGFTFNGKDLLKNATTGRNEAGLMLGFSSTRVSDVVKITNTTRSLDWVLQGSIGTGSTGGDLKELVAVYKEAGTVTNPLGVEVTQRVYGWNTTQDLGYVIIEYRLKNTSSDTLKQLSLGMFADWNLGTITENRADWDAGNNLGYIYESGGAGTHAGIALLTAQTPQHYAFDQDGTSGSINVNDGFNKSEKYESMSGNLGRNKAGETGNGNDVAHTVGARIITIAPGETTMVAFVLVAGTSLTELQSRIAQAKSRFQTRYTSPTPTLLADLKTCGPTGEVTVTPTGGTNFRFYDQVPTPGVTTPIGEGASLRVASIQANRTIYVTSTDSLFEGSHSAVTIRYLYPSVNIVDGLRDLCVDGNLTLTASTSGSTSGAQLSYQWQRNGQNIGSDSVAVLINEPGTYKVTVSEEGCARTSSEVTITQIQKPVITQNGTALQVTATGALTYQWFFNNLPLTGANASSFTPRATGAYSVWVGFGNGCEVLSDAFQIEVTSLSAAPAKLQGVKAYPIPNQGNFTLELPQNAQFFEINVIDFAGRKVFEQHFSQGGKYPIHLPGNDWPNGIYFLKVTSKGPNTKQAIIKLAIQK